MAISEMRTVSGNLAASMLNWVCVSAVEEQGGVGAVDRALLFFFFSSRRRHTRFDCDWSSDVCSSDLSDSKSFQRVPTPPSRNNMMPSAPTDQGDPYAGWRNRVQRVRAELDELKAKRQKAQEDYDDLLRYRRFWSLRLYRIDPIEDAKILSKLNELDQQVRDKEHELTVTIPDEARRAGVPPGALSQ